jgi:hypothetical protein
VLNQSSMLLHGYFILGNFGESLDEMRQILPFARELGLDTIGVSMLRAGAHSGLDELVAANPGYHVAPSGKVFSDACPLSELRKVRRQINRGFYDAAQIYRIFRKGLRNGAMGFLPGLLPRLPGIAWHVGMHLHRRAKRRAERLARSRQRALEADRLREALATPDA